jgi:outer membrane protein OmpA-like peptidoglycan-associated protein
MKRFLAFSLAAVLGSGCATVGDGDKTTKAGAIGTLAGAAAGAVWGAARGDAAKGALIGAATGGALGLATGVVLDRQEEQLRKAGIKAERDQAGNLVVKMSGDTLKFDSGKASLKPEGQAMLDKIAGVVAKYPENRLSIEGHTDNVGKDSANLALSQGRAESVKAYLISKGTPERCVVAATGYGESRPAGDNKTAEGRSLNRRVELKISVDQEEADKNEKDRESYKNSKKK